MDSGRESLPPSWLGRLELDELPELDDELDEPSPFSSHQSQSQPASIQAAKTADRSRTSNLFACIRCIPPFGLSEKVYLFGRAFLDEIQMKSGCALGDSML